MGVLGSPVSAKDIFYILLPISVITLVLGIVGNTLLLKSSYRRYRGMESLPNRLFLTLCISNMTCCYIVLPVHIIKLICDYLTFKQASSFICLFRYVAAVSITSFSFILLTLLVLVRKDKILDVALTEEKLVRKENFKLIMGALIALSSLPNIAIFLLYLFIYIQEGLRPCQKPQKKISTSRILEIVAGAFMILITFPSIVLLLRAVEQIRNKVKSLAIRSLKVQPSLTKLNISFMYVGIFLIFWAPFGIMSFCSGSISNMFYKSWFNIGYTISFGYVAFLPLIFILTETHVQKTLQKTYLRNRFPGKAYLMGVTDQGQNRSKRNSLEKNINMLDYLIRHNLKFQFDLGTHTLSIT